MGAGCGAHVTIAIGPRPAVGMNPRHYYGKILGAVLGWLLMRHPIGFLIGAILGHALDAGWLRRPRGRSALDQAYAVLEVSPQASDEVLETAYRRLMARYHPDRVAGAAEEIRRLAEERSRAINGAYDLITRARRKSREQ